MNTYMLMGKSVEEHAPLELGKSEEFNVDPNHSTYYGCSDQEH